MPDLILMHGENGKTFFVDKDEYLTHWKWGTKYVDKYQNKNGNWVYVYDVPVQGKANSSNHSPSSTHQYHDVKGVDNTTNRLVKTSRRRPDGGPEVCILII